MLSALRTGGTRQALVGLVVFAIIFVFVLEFRSTSRMRTGSLRRECAASIDGECVTSKDYYAEFGLIVPRGMSPKQVKTYGLRRQVLDGVIERELLTAEAHRLGLSVDEESVKKELRLGRAHVSLPAATAVRFGSMLDLLSADETGIERDLVRELPIVDPKTGEVDDDLYSRVVRSMTNRSPKEFLKMQVREVLAARMRDLVRSRVRVSDGEAFDAFMREKSKAVVRFVRLDPDWFGRYTVDTSDEAVDRFTATHHAEVDEAWKKESAKWKADCPLAAEIVLPFHEGITEAQKSLLKDRIDRARARLDEGADFADVAKESSAGPTAVTGGDIGCLTTDAYGEGADVLAKALDGLRPGAASQVVETKGGYHVVTSRGLLAAGDVEMLGKRAAARELLVASVAESAAKELGKKLVAAVQAGARLDDTLQAALPGLLVTHEQHKRREEKQPESAAVPSSENPALSDPRVPKAEVSAPFGIDGEPVPGLLGGPSLGKLAFDLTKVGDVHPEPIAVPGGFVVLQLKEKTMATREEFASQKGDTVRRMEVVKQADALARYVARLRRDWQNKITVNERILEEPKAADRED